MYISFFCGHVTRCHYWKHPFETVGCSLGLYNLKKTKDSEQATVQAFWKTGLQFLSSPVLRANVSIQKKKRQMKNLKTPVFEGFFVEQKKKHNI